jgi:mannose-6-phosphate isomerase
MKYILKTSPAFKDYLWGGTRLKTEFGKKSDLTKVAESWELSCHPDGPCTILNGADAGKTLAQWIEAEGNDVLGTHCAAFDRFPVLIKLIDAKDNLSVQVHPDDDYGMRVEGEPGKTEMWYIVDCDPGATLLYGFNNEITKDEFAAHIRNNTLLDVATAVPVHKGDVFFIEAGTLHAIGSGILIAEIQQNSNTTYRVYDYGRVGVDGKPRALHIDKALDVTTLAPAAHPVSQGMVVAQTASCTDRELAACDKFTVHALDLDGAVSCTAGADSFHSLLVTECADEIIVTGQTNAVTLKLGESAFIPANSGAYTVCGKGRVLLTTV